MADEQILELDAAALKALAHPLRVQILQVLSLRKRASVTSLATELSESTGAMSYHLRQLARHGFVEAFDPGSDPDTDAVPDAVTGRRQRWWRMAADSVHMSGFGFLADPSTREAAGFLLREFADDRARRLAHWYASVSQWPEAWQKASSDAAGFLDLDADQTRALADELGQLIARYRAMEPGDGARRVDFQYAVFPSELGAP